MATNPFDIGTGRVKTDLGLIGSAIPTSSTTSQVRQLNPTEAQTGPAATYNPATRTANQWNVAPDQTVRGQLDSVLAQNSPILQRARQQGLEAANARGLVNSSMGVQAGEAALLDQALRIATPDAGTFAAAGQFNTRELNQAGSENMAATNTAGQFNAGAQNDVTQRNADRSLTALRDNAAAVNAAVNADAGRQLQADLAQREGLIRASLQDADAGTRERLLALDAQATADRQAAAQAAEQAGRVTLANMDAQSRLQLAEVEAKYRTQMQASQSGSSLYSQMIQSIGSVLQDTGLDAGAKQNAINQITGLMDQAIKLQSAASGVRGLDTLIQQAGGTVVPIAPVQPSPGPGIISGSTYPGEQGMGA